MSQENVEVVREFEESMVPSIHVPYYRDTVPQSEAAGMATTTSRV
jgi:hypothetical protein